MMQQWQSSSTKEPSATLVVAQHSDHVPLATKVHSKPHSHMAPSNMAEQSLVTTTIIINSYEVLCLDEQPGLKCCVATCTIDL